MKIFALLFVAFIVFMLIMVVVLYNKLVRSRNQAYNAFAQIDVQLKRRHDLIPNLVEVSKRYLEHEQDTLTRVINARNKADALQNNRNHEPSSLEHMAQLSQAEGMLTKALGQFNVVVEDYPELKADGIIRELTDELTNTENRIGFARQHYNDSVMFYNNEREVFPNNLISNAFNFSRLAELHFADKAAIDQPVNIDMSRRGRRASTGDNHDEMSGVQPTLNSDVDSNVVMLNDNAQRTGQDGHQ